MNSQIKNSNYKQFHDKWHSTVRVFYFIYVLMYLSTHIYMDSWILILFSSIQSITVIIYFDLKIISNLAGGFLVFLMGFNHFWTLLYLLAQTISGLLYAFPATALQLPISLGALVPLMSNAV